MPSCRPDVIPGIIYKVMEIKPKTILEIGVGHGKWGVLCKEYLKYWGNIDVKINGVEVFSKYKNKSYGVYDVVYTNDIMNIEDRMDIGSYDLILMIDVIEHLKKEDGIKLLNSSKRYLVCTPGYWSDQGSCFGNEHESHISKWGVDDFEKTSIIKYKVGTQDREHIIGWK